MILVGIILLGLAFFLGWFCKDYKWTKAARTGKIMVVDGDMYKVKRYTETHGGSVEE